MLVIQNNHQRPKPALPKRGFAFVPPSDFANRIGRTVALHVQRLDWRQAFHTLEAAKREIAKAHGEMLDDSKKSIEQRAAERMLFDVPGIDVRTSNTLEKAGYETVADVLLATDSELLEISEFGETMLAQLRESVRAAGFGPLMITAEGVPPTDQS